MRTRTVLAWAGLLCCSLSVPAMSLREFKQLEKVPLQGVNYANYYLVGLLEGILQEHDTALRAGAAARMCLQGRSLVPASARQLLDAELRRNPGVYEADMPLQLVLDNALTSVYPCVP